MVRTLRPKPKPTRIPLSLSLRKRSIESNTIKFSEPQKDKGNAHSCQTELRIEAIYVQIRNPKPFDTRC
jgi:hypothetical protein